MISSCVYSVYSVHKPSLKICVHQGSRVLTTQVKLPQVKPSRKSCNQQHCCKALPVSCSSVYGGSLFKTQHMVGSHVFKTMSSKHLVIFCINYTSKHIVPAFVLKKACRHGSGGFSANGHQTGGSLDLCP